MKRKIKEEASKLTSKKYNYYKITTVLAYMFSYFNNVSNKETIANVCTSFAYVITLALIGYFKNNCKEKSELRKLLNLYNQYVSNIANLNEEFELTDDVVKINEFFSILLKNGDLSLNRKNNFGLTNVKDLYSEGLLGAELACGTGVCRHVVRLLTDVLQKNGIDSDIVHVNMLKPIENNNLLLLNIPELFSTKKYEFESECESIRKNGNHAVLGVEYGDDYLLMDTTNQDYFFPYKVLKDSNVIKPEVIEKIKKLDVFDEELGYELNDRTLLFNLSLTFSILKSISTEVNLFGAVAQHVNKYDEVIEKIDKLREKNSDIIQIREQITQMYLKNLDIIDKFYEDNKELYSEINNLMSKQSNELLKLAKRSNF